MADYRLYCVSGIGHFSKGEWIEAQSDDEVIALVRAKKLAVSCEIWDGNRLVAQVPPQANQSSA